MITAISRLFFDAPSELPADAPFAHFAFLIEKQISRETLNIQTLEEHLSQSPMEGLHYENTQIALQAAKCNMERLRDCRWIVDRTVARNDRVLKAEATEIKAVWAMLNAQPRDAETEARRQEFMRKWSTKAEGEAETAEQVVREMASEL